VMLSEFSAAWQLYLGLFFVLLVRFAPAGLASLMMMLLRVARFGKFGRIWKPLLAISGVTLAGVFGLVIGIELLYHLTLESANGSVKRLFGVEVDTRSITPWLVAAALMLASWFGYRKIQPGYWAAWSDVNAEIVAKMKGGAA